MSIKSDRWIRRRCDEAQLIHPFEARMVREVAGKRIISAGASSYGYDMRLAGDGFRVFSPIHAREIDPKHFDDESLIEPPLRTADDGSKYYLRPPHSYALMLTYDHRTDRIVSQHHSFEDYALGRSVSVAGSVSVEGFASVEFCVY